MKIEPELLLHIKEDFLMDSGKVIVVEMKLQRLPGINKEEFPQDYKFNLIAYNKIKKEEYILVDNHDRKGPHWHDGDQEEFFSWISWEETLKLFIKKTSQKFGSFPKTFNIDKRYEKS